MGEDGLRSIYRLLRNNIQKGFETVTAASVRTFQFPTYTYTAGYKALSRDIPFFETKVVSKTIARTIVTMDCHEKNPHLGAKKVVLTTILCWLTMTVRTNLKCGLNVCVPAYTFFKKDNCLPCYQYLRRSCPQSSQELSFELCLR